MRVSYFMSQNGFLKNSKVFCFCPSWRAIRIDHVQCRLEYTFSGGWAKNP
jgi:hypothetical protein